MAITDGRLLIHLPQDKGMSKIFALFVFPILMVMPSCFSVPTGLVKTDFKKWHVQKFKNLGLSIELPQQHYFSTKGYLIKEVSKPEYVKKKGFKYIRVEMDPIYFGSAWTEPLYLIGIYVTRLTEISYQNFIHGKGKLGMFGVFQDNQKTFHDKLTMYRFESQNFYQEKKKQYQILRKDYRTSDGNYILCGAKIYAGSEKFIQPDEEDIKAVSRILNSVKELK